MIETEVRQQLRTWIFNRAKDKPADLRDDTPVLERGILSSLDVVELILFIEKLRGSEIEVEGLEPAAFHDVNAIYKTFFVAAA